MKWNIFHVNKVDSNAVTLPVAQRCLTTVHGCRVPSREHGNITLWNGTLSLAMKLYNST